MWLESFAILTMSSQQALEQGRRPEDVANPEHGARCLNAVAVLTEMFA